MSDDIVTRLRGQRTNSVICKQAADEIERLRADRNRWHDSAIHIAHLGKEDCTDIDCPYCSLALGEIYDIMRQSIRKAARNA